jgi:hypothetical protein
MKLEESWITDNRELTVSRLCSCPCNYVYTVLLLRQGPRSSCREGFRKMGILTAPCLYIYAMIMFVIKNHNIYQANNFIHNINTRQHEKLHVSSVRLSFIQKGVHYTSIRIFTNLPPNIHILKDNTNIFKQRLNNFLISNAFYSIVEYITSKQV